MADKTIAQKLFIKDGQTVFIANAPRGYAAKLQLPKGVKVARQPAKSLDAILLFVANRQALEAQLPKLKKFLAPHSLLWIAYYKGTASIKTDINRDTLNAYAKTQGLTGVSLISLDDDWSAMRFKIT